RHHQLRVRMPYASRGEGLHFHGLWEEVNEPTHALGAATLFGESRLARNRSCDRWWHVLQPTKSQEAVRSQTRRDPISKRAPSVGHISPVHVRTSRKSAYQQPNDSRRSSSGCRNNDSDCTVFDVRAPI